MRPRLTIVGEVNPLTGYGQHLLQAVALLEQMGCFVSTRPLRIVAAPQQRLAPPLDIVQRFVWAEQPEQWEVLIAPPLHTPTPGKKTVYWTMWETTVLPKHAVDLVNQAECVVVPSRWCKTTFEESGVVKPIAVVQLGYDDRDFNLEPMDMSGPTVFGVAGRAIHGVARKGLQVAIESFQEAFTRNNEVRLLVKVYPDDPVDAGTADGRIRIMREYFDGRQLGDWFSRLTCFVTAAKSEGFGLLQLQAMACGRPVIGINYSGLADFMTAENSYPVDFDLIPAEDNYANVGKWAHPNVNSLIHQMRRVYVDRREALHKGFVARRDVRSWTWRQSIGRFYDLLQTVGAL